MTFTFDNSTVTVIAMTISKASQYDESITTVQNIYSNHHIK